MAREKLFTNLFTVKKAEKAESLNALANQGARRLGFPDGWAQNTVPIRDADGNQKEDADRNPRFMSKQRCAKFAFQDFIWELIDSDRAKAREQAVAQFEAIDRVDDDDED